jgi:hypothetical protein
MSRFIFGAVTADTGKQTSKTRTGIFSVNNQYGNMIGPNMVTPRFD